MKCVGRWALAVGVLSCVLGPLVGAEEVRNHPVIIAHRGASGYLPEHTLEAYAMAYAQGADYIEPDLVMTRDGHFLCLHDRQLEATTNVEEVFPDRKREDGRWYAADLTLEEIKRLSVHERTDSRFPKGAASFEVATLEELIELVQGLNQATGRDVGIYPELKAPAWHRTEGLPMEEAFLAILARYGYEGKEARVYVQCFESDTLERLRHELGSELPQIMLIGDNARGEQLITREGLDAVAGFAEGIGPAKALVDRNPELVNEAHARGLAVHPWTFRVESPGAGYASMAEELERFFFDYGVDGVFTDFPDKAVAAVRRGTP